MLPHPLIVILIIFATVLGGLLVVKMTKQKDKNGSPSPSPGSPPATSPHYDSANQCYKVLKEKNQDGEERTILTCPVFENNPGDMTPYNPCMELFTKTGQTESSVMEYLTEQILVDPVKKKEYKDLMPTLLNGNPNEEEWTEEEIARRNEETAKVIERLKVDQPPFANYRADVIALMNCKWGVCKDCDTKQMLDRPELAEYSIVLFMAMMIKMSEIGYGSGAVHRVSTM